MEGNTEIIRSKSNATVVQLAKLKDVIDELNDGSSDDTIEEIKRLLESKMIIANGCERGKAYELLEEYVKDRNGIKQSKLYALADERSVPRKDILRAKNEMGLKVISKGYGDNTEKYWYKEQSMNKERTMRWIPLTEEHPEFVGTVKYKCGDIGRVTRKVLCQTRRKEIFVAYGKRQETEDGKHYWHWCTKGTGGRKMEIRSKVIAWMPLPEFYEEE